MASFKSFFRKSKKQNPASFSKNSFTGGTPSASRTASARTNHQQIEELEHVFRKFDANGDGKICSSELGSIMSSLGQKVSDDELVAMIREVDADGDGFIDLQEFIELNTKGVDSDGILVNIRDAFAVYDLDGNGFISAEELMKVMRSLGDNCTISECRKMIAGVDTDSNLAIVLVVGCSALENVGGGCETVIKSGAQKGEFGEEAIAICWKGRGRFACQKTEIV